MPERVSSPPEIRVIIPTPEGCIDETRPFDPVHGTWEEHAEQIAADVTGDWRGVDRRLPVDGAITYLMETPDYERHTATKDAIRYGEGTALHAAVTAARARKAVNQ